VPAQPSKPNKIPRRQAEERVGRALFKDWGSFTSWDERLLEKFSHRTVGIITYSTPESMRADSLTGPLREALDGARYRKERMDYQWERVGRWFKYHGFDHGADEVDRDAFERAFEKAFGRFSERRAPSSVQRRTGPKPKVSVRVAEAMRQDLKTGRFLADDLKGWSEEAGAEEYKCGRQTFRTVRKIVLSQFELATISDTK
jgi:hypothetical protein